MKHGPHPWGKLLIFIFVAIFTCSLFAEEIGQNWGSFTYQDLVQLIKDKHITTIEQLTAALPEELQTNITFQLKPHDKIQDGVRAIRFTSDGKLMITHNDDANVLGGLKVQAFEQTANSEGVLHYISFSPDGKTPPDFTDGHAHGQGSQIESCASCHGDTPRRIWPSYRVWPDACGEDDDKISAKCQKFLDQARTNPRFKDLKWQGKTWPYYDDSNDRTMSTMPNARLTMIVQIENAKEMAKTVEQNPLFKKLKYTFYEQKLCSDREALSRLTSVLKKSPLVEVPGNWQGGKDSYVEEVLHSTPSYTPADNSSRVQDYRFFQRYTPRLFEFFGIPFGNTGSNEKIVRNGVSGINFGYDELNLSSNGFLTAEVLRDETDPKIAETVKNAESPYPIATSYVKKKGKNVDFYAADPKFRQEFESSFLKEDDLKGLCPYLQAKAKKELDDYEAELKGRTCGPIKLLNVDLPTIAINFGPSLEDLVLEKGKEILTSAKCITCHDPQKGDTVGPRLHFTDAKQLAVQDHEYGVEGGKPLLDATSYIMSSRASAERRMPLNAPPLTDDEQKAVMKYLEYLYNSGLQGH